MRKTEERFFSGASKHDAVYRDNLNYEAKAWGDNIFRVRASQVDLLIYVHPERDSFRMKLSAVSDQCSARSFFKHIIKFSK